MKIFLDDEREPSWIFMPGQDQSPDGWAIVRTAEEAIRLLGIGTVTHISFDNDLGRLPGTLLVAKEGWEVFRYMIDAIAMGEIPRPAYINVHTANPVAAKRMWDMLTDYETFIGERGE